MISSDFRWSSLASGYFSAETAFIAYQQPRKKFDLNYLVCSANLVLGINHLFSEIVSRPSWGEKVLKISTYGLFVIHSGVVLAMGKRSVEPANHTGWTKRCVQIWKYTTRILAVTHVALVLMNAKQNRTRAVAYVMTLVVGTLRVFRKLPAPVAKTWTYTPWVAHAFILYDGSSSQRQMTVLHFAMTFFQKVASLSK